MSEKTFSKFNGYIVKDSQARNDIKTINNEISTINTNIGTTNKNVETNKTNIENNSKSITTLNNNIGVINSTIDTIDSSVRSITADNEEISGRMDSIEETFEAMGDIVENATLINDKIDANTTKINEVEEALNNISYVNNLSSTDTTKGLAANQGKVLNESITNLSNGLNAEITSINNEIDLRDCFIEVNEQAEGNDFLISSTSTNKYPLKFISNQYGDKFSITSDGDLKIGAGVSTIEIDVTMTYYCATTNASQVALRKNNDYIVMTYANQKDWNNLHMKTILNVVENDVIYLKLSPQSGDKIRGGAYTKLICKVLK